MARRGHPVFEFIADALAPSVGDLVVDLGCGHGPALHALAERVDGLNLVGLDLDGGGIDEVRRGVPAVRAEVADLNAPLPFADSSIDRVMSHNVVECLDDPEAFMREVRRVLRPSGRAVISHVDFDGIIVSGPDRPLTRRVIHAYADHSPRWMRSADGQMGRRLPGLGHRAGFDVTDVSIHVTSNSRLSGDALSRIDEIAASIRHGVGDLTTADVERWRVEVARADRVGQFMFAEPCFVVTMTAPNSAPTSSSTKRS